MTGVTRVGDMNTGHDSCPAVALAQGSDSVFFNGKGVGRVGDPYVAHGCPAHPSHVGHISSGSSSVFANGLAVGRIGDNVDCDSANKVAAGSPDVIADEGATGIAEAILFSMSAALLKAKNFYTTTVVNQLNGEYVINHIPTSEVDKTIMSLPEIARNMAHKSESGLDEIGWNYLANMFERWLSANNGELDTKNPAFIIDYDWLISYEGIRYYHDDLEQSAFNEAAQKYFTGEIIKNFLGQTEFDCRESFNKNSPIYCNSRALGDSLLSNILYNYFTSPGSYASLASFMLYALPKGKIQQIDNKYRITVEEIYLGAFDSFNFEGDQSYLFWSYKEKDFSGISVFDDNYIFLKNEHFRSFKKTYNRGKDFYVKTNLHKVVNFTPVTFEIELN